MNIEPLLKRFDDLADASERIPALRKVILASLLHSAVNSPDAILSAAILREAHENRRRELIKSTIRDEVPTVPDVVEEDLPPSLSDIPAVLFDRLGKIASIEKGLSRIQSTTPGNYPLVVTAETRSSSDSFDFEGAAAIIPLVSSTGHGDASLKRLHYQEGRYAVGNILAVVKPICPDLLRARFIYEYLSAFKEELLVSRMVGTANVSLTVNKLKEVPVPLVSGPVLSRIDELMALCDRLEAQQQEREKRHAVIARASLARFAEAPTPANLQFLFHPSYAIPPADLRKSILTLAVQGKLVPQDPNDEPVRKQKLRVLPADDVHEIPKEWVWTFWEDVLAPGKEAFKRGPFGSSLRKADFVAAGYKVYEQYCPINDDCSFSRYYITREKFEVMKSFAVQAGDFLISCSGVTLGRITQVPDVFEPGVINQALLRVRIEAAVLDSLYFKMLFRSPYFQERIFANSTGSAIPNVKGVKDLKAMPVLIPPLAEQRRIVAKVEQLMALVDALETQLVASRTTAANLLSAIVAELTGTSNNLQVSASPSTGSGRRGRPRKA